MHLSGLRTCNHLDLGLVLINTKCIYSCGARSDRRPPPQEQQQHLLKPRTLAASVAWYVYSH
eukprot:scaffold239225_cov19-Tisochrysis_lutea.AAC.1